MFLNYCSLTFVAEYTLHIPKAITRLMSCKTHAFVFEQFYYNNGSQLLATSFDFLVNLVTDFKIIFY